MPFTNRVFVCTPASKRVWLSYLADPEVLHYLRGVSKWSESDKREGYRVSYEIKREVSLEDVKANLTGMFMTESTSQETMHQLIDG